MTADPLSDVWWLRWQRSPGELLPPCAHLPVLHRPTQEGTSQVTVDNTLYSLSPRDSLLIPGQNGWVSKEQMYPVALSKEVKMEDGMKAAVWSQYCQCQRNLWAFSFPFRYQWARDKGCVALLLTQDPERKRTYTWAVTDLKSADRRLKSWEFTVLPAWRRFLLRVN